ncbi:2-octaprenylphenol hydroxylase [compost metagenome]
MLGIGARMQDFGKTMLVCRMAHERPHQQVAWEWFGYGQTLALLPLNGDRSSVVLTLPQREMAPLQEMGEEAFAREIERRFDRRLGGMRLLGARHVYPLVGVYAERFAGPRCALIGDAAVGMHPVTAHGFNFGLQSQRRLAEEVLATHRRGGDIGSAWPLQRYALAHRLATWPLYQATSAMNGDRSSVVLTLTQREMAPLQEMGEEAFAREIERRFERRLGGMRLLGARHVYPLVGVYAERFAGPRCALIGDAAVGMHPVTAHGFNFGLQSQRRLAEEVLATHRRGGDIGSAWPLQRYALAHRLATWPLYQATSAIVGLYNQPSPPARLLRNAGLRLAQAMPPLRRAIARHLTQGA